MPVGLSLENVRDVARSRGLSVEQVRRRFIRYRDIADGETAFFAPQPAVSSVANSLSVSDALSAVADSPPARQLSAFRAIADTLAAVADQPPAEQASHLRA